MAVFELYDEITGAIKMSSDYPNYQLREVTEVPSIGSGIVTGTSASEWDKMQLACHTLRSDGKWFRFLFDIANNLPLPPQGQPTLLLYNNNGDTLTFNASRPPLNIIEERYLGEPQFTESEDYRTAVIPFNGKIIGIMSLASSGPMTATLISSYTYHGTTYRTYRITNYFIEPVYEFNNSRITFRRSSTSYISEGHTSPVQSTDTWLTYNIIVTDVTGY